MLVGGPIALALASLLGYGVSVLSLRSVEAMRSQATRLRMRNQGVRAASQFEAILGQLSALAGAGVAGHDDHLVPEQCLHDGFAPRRDRQIGIVFENELEGAARGGRCSPIIRHA